MNWKINTSLSPTVLWGCTTSIWGWKRTCICNGTSEKLLRESSRDKNEEPSYAFKIITSIYRCQWFILTVALTKRWCHTHTPLLLETCMRMRKEDGVQCLVSFCIERCRQLQGESALMNEGGWEYEQKSPQDIKAFLIMKPKSYSTILWFIT